MHHCTSDPCPYEGTDEHETDLSGLRYDGDTIDIGNGRSLRLSIEPDQDTSVNDYDSCGTIEWTNGDRPSNFTGLARIIERDRGSNLWWQPWDGATEQEATEFLPTLTELITYGFSVVGLHLTETITDSLGHDHTVTVDSTYLGGVDDTSPAYLPSILSEMIHELPTTTNP